MLKCEKGACHFVIVISIRLSCVTVLSVLSIALRSNVALDLRRVSADDVRKLFDPGNTLKLWHQQLR